jgi:hypothetical protein
VLDPCRGGSVPGNGWQIWIEQIGSEGSGR